MGVKVNTSIGLDDPANGVVTIGDYNLDYAPENYTLGWTSVVNTNYWSIQLISAMIDDKRIPISTDQAIIDTGTSYVVMPDADFQYVIGKLTQKMICGQDKSYNVYFCLCTDETFQNFPNIQI
mmetsp:Transcript_17740/g.12678  ORF Transcript_17740/g.12678 Transcript_17740/m.12678 type:complete len:123 (-) Transcript_17740:418-786(-)